MHCTHMSYEASFPLRTSSEEGEGSGPGCSGKWKSIGGRFDELGPLPSPPMERGIPSMVESNQWIQSTRKEAAFRETNYGTTRRTRPIVSFLVELRRKASKNRKANDRCTLILLSD